MYLWPRNTAADVPMPGPGASAIVQIMANTVTRAAFFLSLKTTLRLRQEGHLPTAPQQLQPPPTEPAGETVSTRLPRGPAPAEHRHSKRRRTGPAATGGTVLTENGARPEVQPNARVLAPPSAA